MDNDKLVRIERFMADPLLSSAVKDVIMASYLKKAKSNDVNYLAASRIAIDLLEEAWDILGRYSQSDENGVKNEGNVGL